MTPPPRIGRALASLLIGLAGWLAVPARAGAFVLDLEAAPRFETISIEEGLSSDQITCLFQDSRGFLWVGTADGLNRYDGHTIQVFRHDPNDPSSIPGNYIEAIAEDPDGFLWILLAVGGVVRYDSDGGTFLHFRHDPADPESLPFDDVSSAHTAEDGSFWLASSRGDCVRVLAGPRFQTAPVPDATSAGSTPRARESTARRATAGGWRSSWAEMGGTWLGTPHGLFFREPERDAFRQIDHRPVTAVAASRTGHLWIGRGDGSLDKIEPRSMRVEMEVSAPPAAPNAASARALAVGAGMAPVAIRRIVEDVRGQVWLLRASGRLVRYNPSVPSVHPIPQSTPILDVLPDERGSLAVAGATGLFVYDPGADTLRICRPNPGDPWSAKGAPVWHLLEDRFGDLWIGTWGGGVQRWNERATRIRHFSVGTVHAMARGEDGEIWIGSTEGLLRARPRGNDLELEPMALRGQTVHVLHQGISGRLWIGSGDILLARGNPESEPRELCRLGVPIQVLLEDREGRLWIGTNDSLWRWDPGRPLPVRLPHSMPAHEGSLPSALVHALVEDAAGDIWVGTYLGGLSRWNVETERFRHYFADPTDPGSLNNMSMTELHLDRSGRLWVGTYSGGLELYRPESDDFRHFTEREGLAGNQILGLVEDADGDLWISTNQGLSRLDPESETFQTFGYRDGLRAQPFEKGSAAIGADGALYFGGRRGFVRFHPNEIAERNHPPTMAWTALRVDNRKAPFARHVGSRTDLSFRPDEDFIAFEFVGIEFANPERVRYAYRLNGFDDEWIHSGERNYAAYTNLDPGRYLFQARATRNGIQWSDPISLSVEIRPPFYRTAWFQAVASLFLLALLAGGHRLRVRQQIRRSLLEERIRVAERERIREQVARDYHDEMGHKLTKLGIFAELLRRRVPSSSGSARDPLLEYADKIDETVQSLVRDTRDFIWTIDPRRDSAYELALYLQEFGNRLFAETDVRFRVVGMDDSLRRARLSADWKRQLSLLFQEALTNSLRHAGAREVELRFGLVGEELEIVAVDDGRGFEPQAVEKHATRGQGLGNMQRRAESLGGLLQLESGAERGTRLRFVARAG